MLTQSVIESVDPEDSMAQKTQGEVKNPCTNNPEETVVPVRNSIEECHVCQMEIKHSNQS